MTAFDWIAVVGAAAWLPQVIGWVARRFTVPRLRVIPGPSPEIGYTTFGPIFNLPCAISAERKDAVIERVTANVTHEHGQQIHFRWASLSETFSQLKNSEGVAAEFARTQTAVALKVSTLVLTEKLVAMQDPTFERGYRPLVTAAGNQQDHFKKIEPENWQQLTLKSAEFANLIAFLERRFAWQEGRYTVRLELRIVGVKKPTVQVFSFALSGLEVGRLRENLVETERYIRELILQPSQDAKPYRWNWIYPLIGQSGTGSGE